MVFKYEGPTPEKPEKSRRNRQSRADAAIERVDAFVNLATGFGTLEDKSAYTAMYSTRFKTQGELESAYKDLALAARIVDRPATDAVREGWTIKGTDETVDMAEVMSGLEDLQVDRALYDVLRWSRLHGGALLIPLVDDGQPMDQPLRVESVTTFAGFRIVDRWRAMVSPDALAGGSMADYADPEYYDLSSTERDAGGKMLVGRIHKSRVIRFDGVTLPYNMLVRNGYWGMSVLEAGWENLRRLYTVRGYLEDGAHGITGFILKVSGLTKMLKGSGDKPAGETVQKIRESIQRLRNQWDNMHWLALDKEDGIEQQTRNVTGFRELEQVFVDAVVMDYDIPRDLLLHQLKGALTTGESAGAIRLYYDSIAAMQRIKLTPALTRILELYFAATDRSISEWSIEWAPLWQQTESERALDRKLTAETDQIYYTIGALESSDIRQARFVDGVTGPIVIEEEAANDAPDEPTPTREETPEQPAEQPADLAEAKAAVELGDKPASNLALNGAQIEALLSIVSQVASGEVPRETAIQLIALAFPVSEQEAARLLAPVDVRPPPAPTPAPAPGTPPVTPGEADAEGEA